MKKLLIPVLLSLLVLTCAEPAAAQDDPPNYLQIMLEPVNYNEGVKEGRMLIVDQNGVNIKHSLVALGTELSHNESLIWDFSYRLDLYSKGKNIVNFLDGIELQVPGKRLDFDRKHFIKFYSLPSDTSTIFYKDGPYEISLAFSEFEYVVSKDTLYAVVSIPDVVTADGETLIEAQRVKFRGIIRRNYIYIYSVNYNHLKQQSPGCRGFLH